MRQPIGFWSRERASFGFAGRGIAHVWRTQRHFRLQVAFGGAALLLGLLLGLSPDEWAALVVSIALVLCLEMLNTVIETIVDIVSPGYNESARIAKDAAAGAVLVAALGALALGLLLFVPRLLALVGR